MAGQQTATRLMRRDASQRVVSWPGLTWSDAVGLFLAVMIIVGMGLTYSAFLKMLQSSSSPLWVARRRLQINRVVRREVAGLDRQYAEICGS
jgi:hypothetical protein